MMNVKFLILISILYSCGTNGNYKMSDHFNGKTFFNTNRTHPNSFFDLLKWKFGFSAEKWPAKHAIKFPEIIPAEPNPNKVSITFVTHATFLIQSQGTNILTDPVWSDRVSPVSFAGPVAAHKPAISFEHLPKIDIVLISHNHYDHMDRDTIKRLDQKFSPLFIVPLNNAELIRGFGATNIIEMDWWDSKTIADKIKIILTPAQHWSSRVPFDINKSLWGGFFIESLNEKIFFAGDTGYGDHFKEIRKKLGSPTMSLLPIGAYEPRWFMKEMHMNPEDAVLAHLDLESKFSLGMHFGTFQLTDEAIDSPEKDLFLAMDKLKVLNFKAPKPGDNIIL